MIWNFYYVRLVNEGCIVPNEFMKTDLISIIATFGLDFGCGEYEDFKMHLSFVYCEDCSIKVMILRIK